MSLGNNVKRSRSTHVPGNAVLSAIPKEVVSISSKLSTSGVTSNFVDGSKRVSSNTNVLPNYRDECLDTECLTPCATQTQHEEESPVARTVVFSNSNTTSMHMMGVSRVATAPVYELSTLSIDCYQNRNTQSINSVVNHNREDRQVCLDDAMDASIEHDILVEENVSISSACKMDVISAPSPAFGSLFLDSVEGINNCEGEPCATAVSLFFPEVSLVLARIVESASFVLQASGVKVVDMLGNTTDVTTDFQEFLQSHYTRPTETEASTTFTSALLPDAFNRDGETVAQNQTPEAFCVLEKWVTAMTDPVVGSSVIFGDVIEGPETLLAASDLLTKLTNLTRKRKRTDMNSNSSDDTDQSSYVPSREATFQNTRTNALTADQWKAVCSLTYNHTHSARMTRLLETLFSIGCCSSCILLIPADIAKMSSMPDKYKCTSPQLLQQGYSHCVLNLRLTTSVFLEPYVLDNHLRHSWCHPNDSICPVSFVTQQDHTYGYDATMKDLKDPRMKVYRNLDSTERISTIAGVPFEMKDLFAISEKKYKLNLLYIKSHSSLTCRMRAILIDWIGEVCHEFLLTRDTYHVAVALVDQYLSFTSVIHSRYNDMCSLEGKLQRQEITKEEYNELVAKTMEHGHTIVEEMCMEEIKRLAQELPVVDRSNLQLLGITCLSIASKLDEMHPPSRKDFIVTTDNAYTTEQMARLEIIVLKNMKWSLGPLTPCTAMKLYMKLLIGECTRRFADYTEQRPYTDKYPVYDVLEANKDLLNTTVDLQSLQEEEKSKVKHVVVPVQVPTSHATNTTNYTGKISYNNPKAISEQAILDEIAMGFDTGFDMDFDNFDGISHVRQASNETTLQYSSLSSYNHNDTSLDSVMNLSPNSFTFLSQSQQQSQPQSPMCQSQKEARIHSRIHSQTTGTKLSSRKEMGIICRASHEYLQGMTHDTFNNLTYQDYLQSPLYTDAVLRRNSRCIVPPVAFLAAHKYSRLMELVDSAILDSEHSFLSPTAIAAATIALVYPEARLLLPAIFNQTSLSAAMIFIARFTQLPFEAVGLPAKPYYVFPHQPHHLHSRHTHQTAPLEFATRILSYPIRFSYLITPEILRMWKKQYFGQDEQEDKV